MRKLKKRLLRPFCALLLCLTLSGGAAFTSYASVPSIFFSAPEAFAALMAMLGVTSNSSETYSAGDALAAWGSDQIDDMVSYISTSQKYAASLGKLGVDALKENITSWATKAGQGVIDTASNIWGAFRDWVGSLYTNIGSTGGVSYGGRGVSLKLGQKYWFNFTTGVYRGWSFGKQDGKTTDLVGGIVVVDGVSNAFMLVITGSSTCNYSFYAPSLSYASFVTPTLKDGSTYY